MGVLLAAVAVGSTAWLVYGRQSGVRQVTVQDALRLCPADGTAHIGTVTVEGYFADVRVAFLQRAAHGLFPSRVAALARSGAELHTVFPPSQAAVWLVGGRTPHGVVRLAVTGNLDCIFQLPGMGDNRGTFAWLTVRTIVRIPAKA